MRAIALFPEEVLRLTEFKAVMLIRPIKDQSLVQVNEDGEFMHTHAPNCNLQCSFECGDGLNYGFSGETLSVKENIYHNGYGSWHYEGNSQKVKLPLGWKRRFGTRSRILANNMPSWATRLTIEILPLVQYAPINEIPQHFLFYAGIPACNRFEEHIHYDEKERQCVFKSLWAKRYSKEDIENNVWVRILGATLKTKEENTK